MPTVEPPRVIREGQRWVVRGRRVYGKYRSAERAQQRVAQVLESSRPRKESGSHA